MKTPLFNTAHPLAESGKPIFIPFGEWNYDGQSRQRLDRAHGEKIANELNARVAKGDPGIPVYQGHPDVPALAAKYPDKGALGWVVRAELVNEGGKDGLALTVEWDRDPGRGFRWFSPYWLANSRDGGTYIVDEIASIGLVNNPNIPEFRLANEEQPMKKKLNPAIIELAARYDRLANEANFDESKHPRSNDGKFASVVGGGGEAVVTFDGDDDDYIDSQLPKLTHEQRARGEAMAALRKSKTYQSASAERKAQMLDAETKRTLRKDLYTSLEKKVGTGAALEIFRATGLSDLEIHGDPAKVERAAHRAAILSGLTYNPKTHQYE